MSTPQIEANVGAGIYVFRYLDERIAIRVDRLTEERKVLWGEITIRGSFPPEPGWHHIYHEGLNLLAGRTRKSVANLLAEKNPHIPNWAEILEQVCLGVIKRHREGEAVVQVKDIPRPETIQYRVEPLMIEGVPTLIYGFGGTGKSYLSAYLASLICEGYPAQGFLPEPGPVLVLDYENTELDNARRFDAIHQGLGLDDRSSVHYRRCSHPLARDVQEIQKVVLEKQIQVVMVDSAGPACGGDPESAQSAIQFFMALRSLNVTSLVLAHKSKVTGSQGPFGSVYWVNYPRSVFRVQSMQEDDITHIGIIHEKANDGRLMKPLGLRMEFLDGGDSVSFSREDVADVPELEDNLSLSDRMAAAIKRNHYIPMTASELAEDLQSKPDSVRKALRRSNQKFTELAGSRWGLLHTGEDT